MGLPSRDQAIATLEEGHAALRSLFDGLTPEQFARPSTIGGGDWSAKDLMAHIAFWEELAAQAVEEWRERRRPAVEDIFDAGQGGVDAANARNQRHSSVQAPEDVRARADEAHRAVIVAVRELPDGEWRAKAFYPAERRATLGRLLGGVLGARRRPFGHAFAHLPDLRAYVAALGAQSVSAE